MPEANSETIGLLQELREEMRQNFARTETNFTRLEAKMNDGFEHLADEIEEMRRAFAGASVLGRMAAKSRTTA
jgi:hypothetical protein